MPRQWQAIRRDQAFSSDGAYFATNCRFYLEGELQRRAGMTKLTNVGGRSAVFYWTPATGMFLMQADASGNWTANAV
jgi:hypothetical protein